MIEWNTYMEQAPKDGTWIYIRYRHWWADKKQDQFDVLRVRWLMLCPKRGGELQQGWTEDGKTFVSQVCDGFLGQPIRRPEAWMHIAEMEKDD